MSGKGRLHEFDDCRAAIAENAHHAGQLLLGPVAFQGVQDHGDAPSGGLSGGAVVG